MTTVCSLLDWCKLRALPRSSIVMSNANRSEPPTYERRSKENMERHLQTIMIALIVGALTFAANYFYNDNREKGEDRAQLAVLTNQVIELRGDVRAMQGGFARKEDADKLDARIRDLELRVREIEKKPR